MNIRTLMSPRKIITEARKDLKDDELITPKAVASFTLALITATGIFCYSLGAVTPDEQNNPPCFGANFKDVDYDSIDMNKPPTKEGATDVAKGVLSKISYPMTCYFVLDNIKGEDFTNDIVHPGKKTIVDEDGFGMRMYKGAQRAVGAISFAGKEEFDMAYEQVGPQLIRNGDVRVEINEGASGQIYASAISPKGSNAHDIFTMTYSEEEQRWLLINILGLQMEGDSWTDLIIYN